MKKLTLILISIFILNAGLYADKTKPRVEAKKVIDIDKEENKIKSDIADEIHNVISSKGLSEISKQIREIASRIKDLFWSEVCKIVKLSVIGNKLLISLEITIPEKPKALSKEELKDIDDYINRHRESIKKLKQKKRDALGLAKKSKKKRTKKRSKRRRRK